MTSAVKVLHIVGSPRTGSTILGNVLGELEGFFHVGELYNIWKNLLLGRTCGCGRSLPECPFWSVVRGGRFGALPDPFEVRQWQEDTLRIRHLRRLLREHTNGVSKEEPLDAYRGALSQLYRALGGASAARVIVDSSKWPPHAAAASLSDVEPYFIHLVRDPRGVAHSRQGSRTMRGDSGTSGTAKALHVAFDGWSWMKVNMAAEVVCHKAGRGRFLRLRYEDFVTNPRRTLEDVLALVGEQSHELPSMRDRTVQLDVNHTVGGNSNRFRAGPVEIKQDTRWVAALDRGDRLVTTTVTLPLLRRYGYRVDGKAVSDSSRTGAGRVLERHQWRKQ
jgi:Sulfotransferase family